MCEKQNFMLQNSYLCPYNNIFMKSIQLSNNEFFALTKEMLREGKSVDIRVKGNSMRPFLFDGEVVTIAPLFPQSELTEGLIVLADTDFGKVMMHRIQRISGERIIMQGDGNLYQWEEIRREQIFGIARTFRKGKQDLSLYTPARRMAARMWNYYPIRRIGLFLVRILKR